MRNLHQLEAECLWAEILKDFNEALNALPWGQRQTIMLWFWEGVTWNDIAERCNVDRTTVYRWRAQAIISIRKHLLAKGWKREDVLQVISTRHPA